MKGNIGHDRRTDRDGYLPQGVRYEPRRKLTPYRAVINHNNERIHLGGYDTADEAGAVYENARKMMLSGEWDDLMRELLASRA